MQKLKKIMVAVLFALILSVGTPQALAGDITGAPAPGDISGVAAPGDISAGASVAESGFADWANIMFQMFGHGWSV